MISAKICLRSVVFAWFMVSAWAWAQPSWLLRQDSLPIESFVMLQLWGTYTQGQRVWQADSGRYEAVNDRADLQLRRARLGFKGEPYRGLKYTLLLFYDLIGRDLLSGTVGGSNGPTPNLGIWDAFLQWRIHPKAETWYLTAGYFRPQLGRESITSAWSVNSMEKATTQAYLRQHLVGTGAGRATGINLGGLLRPWPRLGLSYNLGVFVPQFTASHAQTMGRQFAPLWVGRAVLHLGDPEQTRYRIGYEINYFGQRKGFSLGVGGAWQGAHGALGPSQVLSMDLLANYGPLSLDGEFSLMRRQGQRPVESAVMRNFTYTRRTAHLRGGFNLSVGRYVIEPALMIERFGGGIDSTSQADAAAVGASAGQATTYDAGINWYLDGKHLKLALHYTWHQADAGDAPPGNTVNLFFYQSEVGPIRRGNWLAMGLSLIF